jgi:hypothetical protein
VGGPSSGFTFVGVEGGTPCFKCAVARDLDGSSGPGGLGGVGNDATFVDHADDTDSMRRLRELMGQASAARASSELMQAVGSQVRMSPRKSQGNPPHGVGGGNLNVTRRFSDVFPVNDNGEDPSSVDDSLNTTKRHPFPPARPRTAHYTHDRTQPKGDQALSVVSTNLGSSATAVTDTPAVPNSDGSPTDVLLHTSGGTPVEKSVMLPNDLPHKVT